MDLATGYPNFMTANVLQTLFSKAVRANLYANTCLPKIATSGYLGELKDKGQIVKIATLPRVTTAKYSRGQEIDINTVAADPMELKVDRARYWSQFFDDLDLAQTHLKMLEPETAKGAASQMASDIEEEFFGEAADLAHASNVGATAGALSGKYNLGTAAAPVQISRTNVLAYISQFFSVIAEQNIADGDGTKSIVIPEWMRWYLVNTSQMTDASKMGEKSTLRTNRVGNLFGIEVYTSNLLSGIAVSGQTYKAYPIFACTRSALNFVVNLNKVEVVRPAKMFGSLSKGVVLYDWGAARSEGISVGYAYAGDSSILTAS